ncbi:hypothetical protein BH11PLA2_BH11PLA2_51390 [soil metagenome]
MNRRLLSPLGAATLFTLLTLMVLGGLTWVTLESLRLEAERRQASTRADLSHVERLALWQLDSRLFPAWGVENNRPYAHYFPLHTLYPVVFGDNGMNNDEPARVASPLLCTELPSWMKLHVQLDPETGWESPQVMSSELETKFHDQLIDLYELNANNLNGNRSQALADLKQQFPAKLIHEQLMKLESVNLDDSPLGVPYQMEQQKAQAPVPTPVTPPQPGAVGNNVRGGTGRVPESKPEVMTRVLPPTREQPKAEPVKIEEKKAEGVADPMAATALAPAPSQMPAPPVVAPNAQPATPPSKSANGYGAGPGGGRMGSPSQQALPSPPDYDVRRSVGNKTVDELRNKSENVVVPNPAPGGPQSGRGEGGGNGRGILYDTAGKALDANTDASKDAMKKSDGGKDRKADAAPGATGTVLMAKGADNALPEARPQVPQAPQAGGFGGEASLTTDPKRKRDEASDKQNEKLMAVKPGEPKPQGASADKLAMNRDGDKAAAPPPALKGDNNRKNLALQFRPPTVHLGPMRPVWITAANGDRALMLVRAAKLESKVVFQGVLLDWPRLQDVLLDEVRPQLPEAKLEPIRDDAAESDRRMSALPAVLDPGPEPVPTPAGWTPLRIGLSVGWLAALAALAATGFVGWTLLDLSERRIRFVSAVTHELRTPLTSLRLYLDLLTSGMITDEKTQKEYLQTLNTESDRLNRLIENVLDFAKLEKRTVQAQCALLPVQDILDPIRDTWADRLAGESRELVIVNTLPPEQTLHTDSRIATQVLGNLIDNARKYSASAEDRRIWLFARSGDGKLLQFDIEDRGPGVPAAERASIFKPFRRGSSADTTAGGAGLGLALAKQWADMLGGKLSYRVADGGLGACFRLELPIS